MSHSANAMIVSSVVRDQLAKFDTKQPVAYATAAALPASTYANGAAGVGATLTGNVFGVLPPIDGIAIATLGTRILVKNEATPANNGIYTLTRVGVPLVSAWQLTRAADADAGADLGPGILVAVEASNAIPAGLTNNGDVYLSLAPDGFVTGTDAITFVRVGAATQSALFQATSGVAACGAAHLVFGALVDIVPDAGYLYLDPRDMRISVSAGDDSIFPQLIVTYDDGSTVASALTGELAPTNLAEDDWIYQGNPYLPALIVSGKRIVKLSLQIESAVVDGSTTTATIQVTGTQSRS